MHLHGVRSRRVPEVDEAAAAHTVRLKPLDKGSGQSDSTQAADTVRTLILQGRSQPCQSPANEPLHILRGPQHLLFPTPFGKNVLRAQGTLGEDRAVGPHLLHGILPLFLDLQELRGLLAKVESQLLRPLFPLFTLFFVLLPQPL